MELEIHPECQRMIDYLPTNPTSNDTSTASLENIREANFHRMQLFSGGSDCYYDGNREDLLVPSPYSKDGIPVFIYKPNNVAWNPAIFLYLHGGGMVVGTRHSCDPACKRISSGCRCIVVNIEYRLAPEHKFPAPMDDAAVVVNWAIKNKITLGGTDQSIVGVGGDSAGGCITASVAHDLPVQFQVLVYPSVLKRREYNMPSMQKYKDGPLLTLQKHQWFTDMFVPPGEEGNPRLASILRPTFDHLPPALVLIAEHDISYDSGWLYARKMQEHGVPVEVHEFKTATHSFFRSTAFCPTLCAEGYKKVSDFISRLQQK